MDVRLHLQDILRSMTALLGEEVFPIFGELRLARVFCQAIAKLYAGNPMTIPDNQAGGKSSRLEAIRGSPRATTIFPNQRKGASPVMWNRRNVEAINVRLWICRLILSAAGRPVVG